MRNFPRPLTGLQSPFGAGESRPIWDYAAALGGAAPSGLAFAGANGTYFDSAGVLQDAVSNTPRLDYNPATLAARGILIEPERTNYNLNSVGNGAVVGTPGTMPTKWWFLLSGLSSEVVSIDTEDGMQCITFRVFGTASGGSGGLRFNLNADIAAVSGEHFACSFFARAIGSMTGINTVQTNIIGLTGAGAATADTDLTTITGSMSADSIRKNRVATVITLADATTANLRFQLLFTHTIGATVNFTFKVALPQVEKCPSAAERYVTSPIKTSGSAVTRAADLPTGTLGTFSRASGKSWFNSSGVMTDYAVDERVYDYDPATGFSRGLLIEPARTNGIRNSVAAGGSAGVMPTNWSSANPAAAGLTRTIVGTGTDSGLDYVEIRVYGTATAGSFFDLVISETSTSAITASNGVTLFNSIWIKLVAGSMSGLSSGGFRPTLYLWNSGGGYIKSVAGTYRAATGSWTRIGSALTTNDANCAFVQPPISYLTINGAAIDFTVRLALPQLEVGSSATSPIKTSGSAVTRAADVASFTGAPFYSVLEVELEAAAAGALSSIHGVGTEDAASLVSVGAGPVWATSTKTNDTEQAALAPAGTPATGTVYRIVHAVDVNDLRACVNGGAVVQDTGASVPVPANIRFGADGDGANPSAFWLRRMRIINGNPAL